MSTDHYIRFHDVTVSLMELRVWHEDKEIHFTLSELRLLLTFLSEPYRTFSRDELVARTGLTSVSALHEMITRLRTLLDQQFIFTARGGLGYSFAQVGRLRIPNLESEAS